LTAIPATSLNYRNFLGEELAQKIMLRDQLDGQSIANDLYIFDN